MNKKLLNELYVLVNDMMKASNSYDVPTFETIKQTLEKKMGKELDNAEDIKISQELLNNYKEAYLRALQGNATWDMMMTLATISKQSESDYATLQTKNMNEVQSLFINELAKLSKEKNDDKKEIYAEMQDALDKPEEDDGAE